MSKLIVRLFTATSVAVLCTASLGGQQATKADIERAYNEVLAADTDEALKEAIRRYKSTLPKIGNEYVVEGDLLRTDREVDEDLVFARARTARIQQEFGPELLINLKPNGARDYWVKPSDRTLIYSLDRKSFPSPEHAAEVVSLMRAAADAWEQACLNCGIRFVFKDDPSPSHTRATFIVRHVNVDGAYIAAAFFPSYAPRRRYLNIDSSFFKTTFDKTGVLRHELGHSLGYRHEHIRGVPGCYMEGFQWQPLTPYDSKSVMHYMCGGGGSLALALTDLDRTGHQILYGAK